MNFTLKKKLVVIIENVNFKTRFIQKIKFLKIMKNMQLHSSVFIVNEDSTMQKIQNKTSFFTDCNIFIVQVYRQNKLIGKT